MHYVQRLNGKVVAISTGEARSEDGTLLTDPEPLPDGHPDLLPDLSDLKAGKLVALNAQAQAIADQLTMGYPEFEKTTWPDQQAEALAWNADNATPTPYIDGMADERGIDRVLYLQRTVIKVNIYRAAAQKLIGQRQKYADQIAAATSAADLNAIEPTFSLE